MKNLLALILLLFACATAQATPAYGCSCGAGSVVGCVAGSNTAPYDTPAKAATTSASWKTAFQGLLAGESLLNCQGGAIDAFALSGSVQNTNCTKGNPCIVGSYDDSARWGSSNGVGIKPKLNCNTGGVDCLSFNKASLTHTEGYVVQDIEIVGASDTPRGIFIAQDDDYITIQRVKISGTNNAIQCLGGPTVVGAAGTGLSEHITIRDSNISNNRSNGIEASCYDMLIENNVMDHNASALGDHHIYIDGATQNITAVTISSVIGDGTTTTVTTSTPHGIPLGNFKITKSGTTPAGFDATAVAAIATDTTHFTYLNATNATASVVGAYTANQALLVDQIVIRGNTLTNASFNAAGTCQSVALVFHGQYKNVFIEDNVVREDTVPSNTSCWGIGVNPGSYGAQMGWGVESHQMLYVRGNNVSNYFVGINMSQTTNAVVENNYVYSEISTTNQLAGIRYPTDNVPLTAYLAAGSRLIARNNSIYFKNPNSGGTAVGIQVSRDGTNHQITSNLIYFGAGGTTGSTSCFNSDGKSSGTVHSDATYQLANTAFDAWDYNLCFGNGYTPTWSWDAGVQNALAAHQTFCSNISCDTHSLTTDPTITAPAAPGYSLAIPTGSPAKNAGHPTKSSPMAFGGVKRDQGSPDIGAHEFGATTVVPSAATRVCASATSCP